MLTEDFPCAEMVVFGKNGSDACTVAARLARVHTGRRVILYSGYHGWQDFWAEQAGFGHSGIPDRPEALIRSCLLQVPEVPLVLLTGFGSSALEAEFRHRTVAVVPRPFHVNELRDILQSALR